MATTLVLGLALFLAMAAHSDATYCVCNTGATDALQRNIDYACGNGADCAAINLNGACYNPNTVRDHCNYAVNSYYQRRGQIQGSCDFSGTATVTPNPPSGTSSGCVYQASPSGGGTTPTTPGGSTTPPTGGGSTTTPPGSSSTTPPGSSSTTPPGSSSTNPGGTTPGSGSTTPGGMTPGAGSTTNPGGMTPSTTVPPGGTAGGINTLGPSGSGLGPDYSAGVSLSPGSTAFMLVFYSATLLLSGQRF